MEIRANCGASDLTDCVCLLPCFFKQELTNCHIGATVSTMCSVSSLILPRHRVPLLFRTKRRCSKSVKEAKGSKLTLSGLCHSIPYQTSAPLVTWQSFLEKRTSWTQAQWQSVRSTVLAGHATVSCMNLAMVLKGTACTIASASTKWRQEISGVPSPLTSAILPACRVPLKAQVEPRDLYIVYGVREAFPNLTIDMDFKTQDTGTNTWL